MIDTDTSFVEFCVEILILQLQSMYGAPNLIDCLEYISKYILASSPLYLARYASGSPSVAPLSLDVMGLENGIWGK